MGSRYRAKILPVRCSSVRDALKLLHYYCSWGWNFAVLIHYAAVQWHRPCPGSSPLGTSLGPTTRGAATGLSLCRHPRVYPPAALPQVASWSSVMTMEPAGKCPGAEQVMRSRQCGIFIQTDLLAEDEVSPSMDLSILFLSINTLLPPEIAWVQPCAVFQEMPACFFVAVYGFKCFSFYCILQIQ